MAVKCFTIIQAAFVESRENASLCQGVVVEGESSGGLDVERSVTEVECDNAMNKRTLIDKYL